MESWRKKETGHCFGFLLNQAWTDKQKNLVTLFFFQHPCSYTDFSELCGNRFTIREVGSDPHATFGWHYSELGGKRCSLQSKEWWWHMKVEVAAKWPSVPINVFHHVIVEYSFQLNFPTNSAQFRNNLPLSASLKGPTTLQTTKVFPNNSYTHLLLMCYFYIWWFYSIRYKPKKNEHDAKVKNVLCRHYGGFICPNELDHCTSFCLKLASSKFKA